MSPSWYFDEATLERTAKAFDNPDFVDVVIHCYRHSTSSSANFSPSSRLTRKSAFSKQAASPPALEFGHFK